jgi:hypothetical protein
MLKAAWRNIIKIVGEYESELKLLDSYLQQQVSYGNVLQVLEAGCGREWYFRMDGMHTNSLVLTRTVPHWKLAGRERET